MVEKGNPSTDATRVWLRDEIGLSPGETEGILEQTDDLRDSRQLLDAVFPEPPTRAQWLQSPSRILHGRSPVALLRAGGVSDVVEALATLESGAFTWDARCFGQPDQGIRSTSAGVSIPGRIGRSTIPHTGMEMWGKEVPRISLLMRARWANILIANGFGGLDGARGAIVARGANRYLVSLSPTPPRPAAAEARPAR